MNDIQKDFVRNTVDIMANYFKEKMDEKEKEGFLITREMVEEIIQELRDSVK